MNKPKNIGTAAETAAVRHLQANGFPHAERRALRGTQDAGDITGCMGICIEVKGGNAARNASDAQVAAWLEETEQERINAAAEIGVLVLQRRGVGPANAGRWWAVMRLDNVLSGTDLAGLRKACPDLGAQPVRMLLADAVTLLRAAGYGTPKEQP